MASAITLRVLTPAGVALEAQAVSIIAPGEAGYLGILRNHAPLVTTIAPGRLTWQPPGGTRHMSRVGGGLLEAVANRVTILTDTVSEPQAVSERMGGVT